MTPDSKTMNSNKELDTLISSKGALSQELLKTIKESQPASNFFAKQLHKKLQNLKNARLTIIDPHGTYQFGQNNPDSSVKPLEAIIRVKQMDAYKNVALGGPNGAAEMYIQGKWETNDLTTVIRLFARNRTLMQDMDSGLAKFGKYAVKAWHSKNKNTKTGSKKNIASHYDLGNDFFELFLDEEMMYSSYLYQDNEINKAFDDETMQQASIQKLEKICTQLSLTENDHVIEIGTGWGGFACYAAQATGCKVTTTTISQEQYSAAQAKVKSLGLEDKVTVIKEDYRDLKGQYDKLVSIEMIEAVGHQFMPNYFTKLSELLKPNGQALLQAITIEDHTYEQAKNTVDYIKRYIFPGGFLPSVSEISKHAGHNGLILNNLFDMGLSYAKTLRDWRTLFFQNYDTIKNQGFDDRFMRMWEYYLCYCEGGFDERAISVVQANFRKNPIR